MTMTLALATACSSTGATGEGGSAIPETSPTKASTTNSGSDATGTSEIDAEQGIEVPKVPGSSATEAPVMPEGALNDPPTAGRYVYRQDGYQTFGTLRFNFDPEGTFDVEPAAVKGGTARQVTTRRYADSRERETLTQFRSDAILLEQAIERIGSGATRQTFTCKTPDPVPVLPIPWRVGGKWKGGGECSGLILTYSAELREVEKRMVGSTQVRTLVIQAEYTISGDDLSQKTEATIWFAPDYRIVARQVESSSGTFQGTPFKRELTEQLESLAPSEI